MPNGRELSQKTTFGADGDVKMCRTAPHSVQEHENRCAPFCVGVSIFASQKLQIEGILSSENILSPIATLFAGPFLPTLQDKERGVAEQIFRPYLQIYCNLLVL